MQKQEELAQDFEEQLKLIDTNQEEQKEDSPQPSAFAPHEPEVNVEEPIDDPAGTQKLLEDFESGNFVLNSFSDYISLKKAVGANHAAAMATLYDEACQNFPILVLCDLNGTLCYREKTKKLKHLKVKKHHDLKYKAFEVFFRPGCYKFLQKIMNHKRARFAFSTSISEEKC